MSSHSSSAGRRRLVLFAVVAGVLGLLLVWALAPRALEVDAVSVSTGPLRVTLDEEGETRVRDLYSVSSPTAGRVLRIDLEPGDEVRAGETVLARVQPNDAQLLDARSRATAQAALAGSQAAESQARAERAKAEAEAEQARAEADRYRRLFEQAVVSRDQFETYQTAARAADAALEAADSARRSARADVAAKRAALDRGTGGDEPVDVLAPIDGVVLRRLRESEGTVTSGETLLELADPAKLEIVADFLSSDAVQIEAGDAVEVIGWGGDEALQARVRRVEPAGRTKVSALGVEEQRVDVVIDFEQPRAAWNALGDGYRVEVQVVIWESDAVVRVPTGAIFRDARGSWAVFRVEDGVAALRAIELGHRNARFAEVLAGLEDGDRVIAHPSDQLEDGLSVEDVTAEDVTADDASLEASSPRPSRGDGD